MGAARTEPPEGRAGLFLERKERFKTFAAVFYNKPFADMPMGRDHPRETTANQNPPSRGWAGENPTQNPAWRKPTVSPWEAERSLGTVPRCLGCWLQRGSRQHQAPRVCSGAIPHPRSALTRGTWPGLPPAPLSPGSPAHRTPSSRERRLQRAPEGVAAKRGGTPGSVLHRSHPTVGSPAGASRDAGLRHPAPEGRAGYRAPSGAICCSKKHSAKPC